MQTFIAPRGQIIISLQFSGPLIRLWICMDCCLKTKIKISFCLIKCISTCVTVVQWCRLFTRRLWVQICRWARACSFLPQSVGMNVKLTGECGCGCEASLSLWCPTPHAATYLPEIKEDAHLYIFSNFQTWGLSPSWNECRLWFAGDFSSRDKCLCCYWNELQFLDSLALLQLWSWYFGFNL